MEQKLNNHIRSLMQFTSLSKALQHKVERLQIDLILAQQAERQAREIQTQLQNECDTLKSQLAQKESELNPLKKKLSAQRDQPLHISTELDSVKSELQQLREQFRAQEHENQELCSQLADQTEMVELLKSDLNERGNGAQALCAELAAVKANAETVETLRVQAEERQQQFKASLEQAQANIATLKNELEQKTEDLDSLEQAKCDLSGKIESYEAKYEQVKQANQEQAARNSELEIMLNRVEAELEQSKLHKTRLENELVQAHKLTHAGQQAITALSDKYGTLDQNYAQASNKLESLRGQLHVTSGKNTELQARNANIEAQLQDRTKKIDTLGKQLHALQEKLAHEQQEKQKLGDSIQRMGAALSDKRIKERSRALLPIKILITVMLSMIVGFGIQHYRQELNVQKQTILNSFADHFAKWWARVKGTEETLITLTSFTATPSKRAIILQWNTKSEIDNKGFNLYRAESLDGEYVKINSSLIHAKGSPTQGASYKFINKNVKNRKTYWYKLEDVDIHQKNTMRGPVSAMPKLISGIR